MDLSSKYENEIVDAEEKSGTELKKLLIEKLIDEIREHPNLQMKKTDDGGKSANGKKAEASKKTENVQDAHEAIRPSSILRTPEKIKNYLIL